jgi:16S rRNA (cytosine1402-N4)-methyltransferase
VTTPTDSRTAYHRPVLVEEVVTAFREVPSGWLVDGTLGGGGHTRALLAARPDLRILGLDVDPEAIEFATSSFGPLGDRVRAVQSDFRDLKSALAKSVPEGPAAVGVLLDLGVSSHQIDTPERGFSYLGSGPLDMRMGPSRPIAAAEVIDRYAEQELVDLFIASGESPQLARRIGRAVTAARPIAGTAELADIVSNAVGSNRARRGHPAKRVFQALRIEVNDELGALAEGLRSAVDVLIPTGRLAVISYHSGEDRLVKSFLREQVTGGCRCPVELGCVCGAMPRLRLVQRSSVKPKAQECEDNPRAASARLRIAERLAGDPAPAVGERR